MATPCSGRTYQGRWEPTISQWLLASDAVSSLERERRSSRHARSSPPATGGTRRTPQVKRSSTSCVRSFPCSVAGGKNAPDATATRCATAGSLQTPQAGASTLAPTPTLPSQRNQRTSSGFKTQTTNLPANWWEIQAPAMTDGTFPTPRRRTQLPLPPSPLVPLQGVTTILPARAVTSRRPTRWDTPRPRQDSQTVRRVGRAGKQLKKPNYQWLETGVTRISQQAQAWSGLCAYSSPLVKRYEGAKNLVALMQKALSMLRLVVKTDAKTIINVMGEQRA